MKQPVCKDIKNIHFDAHSLSLIHPTDQTDAFDVCMLLKPKYLAGI